MEYPFSKSVSAGLVESPAKILSTLSPFDGWRMLRDRADAVPALPSSSQSTGVISTSFKVPVQTTELWGLLRENELHLSHTINKILFCLSVWEGSCLSTVSFLINSTNDSVVYDSFGGFGFLHLNHFLLCYPVIASDSLVILSVISFIIHIAMDSGRDYAMVYI